MSTVYWLSVMFLLVSACSVYMSHYVADDHRWGPDWEQAFQASAWVALTLCAFGFWASATF